MSLAPIVTILQSARIKVAKELQDCNRICQILILTLQRVTSPCFLPKKSTDRAKSNPVFFQEGGEEIGWVGCGWVYLLSSQIAGQGSEGQTSVGRSWNLLFSRNCFVFKPWNWQKLHFFQTSNFNILCFNSEMWIIGRHVIL